ncbi:unnamed protein product [Camellia sinensis]
MLKNRQQLCHFEIIHRTLLQYICETHVRTHITTLESTMTMKRIMREDREIEKLAMADCLMLLSRAGENITTSGGGRVFACKTCNREFHSFQALGGHRASHKKPTRLMVQVQPPPKPKKHECSVCGLEFATGQALGGHTRRHRAVDDDDDDTRRESVVEGVAALMQKSSSSSGGSGDSKRVLWLDLNLTPYENHMKVKKTPS